MDKIDNTVEEILVHSECLEQIYEELRTLDAEVEEYLKRQNASNGRHLKAKLKAILKTLQRVVGEPDDVPDR